jgi:putative glutamine amidotransferase
MFFLINSASAKVVGVTMDYRTNENGKNESGDTFANKTPFYALRDNYISSFQKACKEYGITVIGLPLDKTMIENYAELMDGLVFTGNYYDINPKTYGQKKLNNTVQINDYKNNFEMKLFKKFYKTKKPIFGICGGHQMMNVALGGELYQDIPSQVKQSKIKHSSDGKQCSHDIQILEKNKIFNAAFSKAKNDKKRNVCVNSVHHQAISKIASDLEIAAVAPDGVIEGYEAKNHPFLVGVQWHPEYELSAFDTTLIKEFCKSVAGN